MARRGENIYKRKDGRWEGRYSKGRKLNGQIKYGYVYSPTYSGVKQKLIHYKYLYQRNDVHLDYIGSVSSWLEDWLNLDVKKRVKKSTFASYQHKVQHYISPYIGKKDFQKISIELLQDWVDSLTEKGISATTVKLVVQIFRMSFKSIQKKNSLWKDPTEGLIVPKVKKRKVRALTLEEQKKVEKEASKRPNGASVLISLYTGLRIGEISALKWSDIDFSLQVIYVQRTMQRIPLRNGKCCTQLIIQEAKTAESEREVPFSSQLKKYLLQLKKQSSSLFVVATKEKALEPRSITYHFRKLLNRIHLEHLHFHQLRHTFATRALEVGGDIASISALLGHHSPNFTLGIYMDSLVHQRIQISKKVEKKYFIPQFV